MRKGIRNFGRVLRGRIEDLEIGTVVELDYKGDLIMISKCVDSDNYWIVQWDRKEEYSKQTICDTIDRIEKEFGFKNLELKKFHYYK